MAYINSNLSYDELERMAYMRGGAGPLFVAGLLSEADGLEHAMENAETAENYINEAAGYFMPEDFLADQFAQLQAIIEGMRKGERRDELAALLLSMEEARNAQANESAEGADILKRAAGALNGED